jgi:hypothetical protein
LKQFIDIFFLYEIEKITSRKVLFSLYDSGKQLSRFKLWIGGLLGGNSIAFVYGDSIDVNQDSSMNESFNLEEYEGELRLKPMGLGFFGTERDKSLLPKEVADYLWRILWSTI